MLHARTILYKVMVAGPAVLLASVAIHARIFVDDYQIPQYSESFNQRLEAYTDVVVQSERVRRNDLGDTDRHVVSQTLVLWSDGRRSGKLKPLIPTCYEDDFDIPAKRQVLRAFTDMATAQHLHVLALLRGGNHSEAAHEALIGFDACQTLRYSDFTTLARMSMMQRKFLTVLQQVIPSLSDAERAQALARLEAAELWDLPVGRMAALARRNFVSHMAKSGVEVTSLEESPRAIAYSDAHVGINTNQVLRDLRVASIRAEDRWSFESEISFGYEAAIRKERKLATVKKQLRAEGPKSATR